MVQRKSTLPLRGPTQYAPVNGHATQRRCAASIDAFVAGHDLSLTRGSPRVAYMERGMLYSDLLGGNSRAYRETVVLVRDTILSADPPLTFSPEVDGWRYVRDARLLYAEECQSGYFTCSSAAFTPDATAMHVGVSGNGETEVTLRRHLPGGRWHVQQIGRISAQTFSGATMFSCAVSWGDPLLHGLHQSLCAALISCGVVYQRVENPLRSPRKSEAPLAPLQTALARRLGPRVTTIHVTEHAAITLDVELINDRVHLTIAFPQILGAIYFQDAFARMGLPSAAAFAMPA